MKRKKRGNTEGAKRKSFAEGVRQAKKKGPVLKGENSTGPIMEGQTLKRNHKPFETQSAQPGSQGPCQIARQDQGHVSTGNRLRSERLHFNANAR